MTTTLTSVTDIDGNTYQLTKICNQTFTTKNLEVTHYRNGDIIPQVSDVTTWNNLTTGAWCYYQFLTANGPVYGKCYNSYAINDASGLAPEGFHIPSRVEFDALINCVGNDGIKLREVGYVHWPSGGNIATNASGLTVLPFGPQVNLARFWSTTIDPVIGQNLLTLTNTGVFIVEVPANNSTMAANVRCIMD
ncbi:MAG: FISUMP domain-containing protein [Flavobacterium sp.]